MGDFGDFSMPRKASGPLLIGMLIAVALAVVLAVVLYTVNARSHRATLAAPDIAPTSSTQPTEAAPAPTIPQSRPASPDKPKYETTYVDVLRAAFPSLPTTQPLAFPLELNQAARLVMKDPIFLSKSSGDLWITRPAAPPTAQVLKQAVDPAASDAQAHVLRERVAFVDWLTSQSGSSIPYLICDNPEGSFELVSAEGRKPLPNRREYLWDRAFPWDDKVVVPSRTGISVFQFRPEVKEFYRDLMPGPTLRPATLPTTFPSDQPRPQALPDGQGLLAWVPCEHGHRGSRGAVRFLDDKWIELGPDQSWPEKIVQLVPLRDGTVFQFIARDDGAISVETMPLEGGSVDEPAIAALVEKLNDADPDERRKAVAALANFGPGAWPILTKLSASQPPQPRLLLKQLLKDKNRPTLSGMTLLGDRLLQLAARLSDGGAVFYAPQGISLPNPDSEDEPVVTAPAWLSLRPGHFAEPLSPALVTDLKLDDCHLDVVGDQWIAITDVRGPRLFFGNGFATLLRKDEREFSRVLGVDSRGRWLFRKPDPASTETLVIDPHFPDPVPRLPVWNLAIAQTVGWDKDNWPVIQNGAAYALTETDWRPLNADEKFFTRPDQIPPSTMPVILLPSPSTTRTADTAPASPPILVTSDHTQYFGGLSDLTVIAPTGKQTVWPLPASANGIGPATLIATKSGKLFLFNQPGRVLRITPTPGAAQPFKLDATFTRNVPNTAKPTRIWLDPAGRIDIVYDARLAILFPDGYIPRPISEKMLDQPGLDAEFQ